jgi:hypothetical protein
MNSSPLGITNKEKHNRREERLPWGSSSGFVSVTDTVNFSGKSLPVRYYEKPDRFLVDCKNNAAIFAAHLVPRAGRNLAETSGLK